MARTIDTLLLLALPASGKSEVRRYLAHQSPDVCARDFHLGPTVQLDDFPYVHMMRRIDEELVHCGKNAVFFQSGDKPFRDARDWGTLIALLNEDFDDLHNRPEPPKGSAAIYMMERIDRARVQVGARSLLAPLDGATRGALADVLEREARDLVNDKFNNIPASLHGKTIVIEFARGGPHNSPMPLSAPWGYAYSLAQLSPAILSRSAILYVWVTPEESRRKNQARTDPNDPGSILHHGVPIDVMMNDYGCDDMAYLLETSGKADQVAVRAHGQDFSLAVARFDNRQDKTSFVRVEPSAWAATDVKALHQGLSTALQSLV